MTLLLCLYGIGIKDASNVSTDLSFRDLGLDSLMTATIQQTLERDYGISVPTKDIPALTFAKLDQLSTSTLQSAGDTVSTALPNINKGFGSFAVK